MTWQTVKLGECIDILSGFAFESERFSTDKGIKLIRIRDVVRGYSDTYYDGSFDKKYLIKKDDILIGMDGEFNRARWASEDALLNQRVCKISVKDSVLNKDFLYHLLPKELKKIEDITPFVTVKHLSVKTINEIQIRLPPLEEQQRIAAILDKAEIVKRKRELAIEKLDLLAESIFIDMFGNPATNPKKWPKKTLSEIVLKITDGEHLNPNFKNNGMPIVMAGNVLDNKVDIDVARFVSCEDGLKFRKKCNPEVGDLLVVSRGATIGRMCVVNETRPFCLMGSVILIKVNKTLMDSEFLTAFLKLPVMRKILYKTSGSSAQQAIYLKDLKNIECVIPPLKIQHQFSLVIKKIKRFNDLMIVNKSKIQNLESSLQSQAFSGQL